MSIAPKSPLSSSDGTPLTPGSRSPVDQNSISPTDAKIVEEEIKILREPVIEHDGLFHSFKAFLITRFNEIHNIISNIYKRIAEKLYGLPIDTAKSREFLGSKINDKYYSGVEKVENKDGTFSIQIYSNGQITKEPNEISEIMNGMKQVYFLDESVLIFGKNTAILFLPDDSLKLFELKDGVFAPIPDANIQDIINDPERLSMYKECLKIFISRDPEALLIHLELIEIRNNPKKNEYINSESKILTQFSRDFQRAEKLEISDTRRNPDKVFSPDYDQFITSPLEDRRKKIKQQIESEKDQARKVELKQEENKLNDEIDSLKENRCLTSYQCIEDAINFSGYESDKKWLSPLQDAVSQSTLSALLGGPLTMISGRLVDKYGTLTLAQTSTFAPVRLDIHRKESGEIDFVDVTWQGSVDLVSNRKKVVDNVISGQIAYKISFDKERNLQITPYEEKCFLKNNL